METTVGYKSPGFYAALVATLLGAFTASGLVGDGTAGMTAAGLALSGITAAGYAGWRTWTKGATGKPAYKTTEFWLALVSVVVAGLVFSGAFGTGSTVMKVLGLLSGLLGAMGYHAPKAFIERPNTN